MTVVGIDDTDSRERGMCTTDAAARLRERLGGRCLLVRLNPAVPYKTRGNAALAVITDASADTAFDAARDIVDSDAELGDDRTNPGVVVAPDTPADVPTEIADWTDRAMRELLSPETARNICARHGYQSAGWQTEQGLVGALAAIGAERAWTRSGLDTSYETISYRERDRWGTERRVDAESLFDAAAAHYPTVWDTVDRVTGDLVAVPHTPGPVLYAIRGDDPDATRACARAVDSESVVRRCTFETNQGTDAHLAPASVADARDGRGYRLDATVSTAPETRQGGHVFLELADGEATVGAAAFAPTGRFRDWVRALRVGDDVTVCGEVTDGTVKLEKLAVRSLVETERVTPECPDCGRRMESAGRGQGYRCKGVCGTTAPGKVEQPVERDIETGWYEVPPHARRHVARPLIRGGFDGPVHPER